MSALRGKTGPRGRAGRVRNWPLVKRTQNLNVPGAGRQLAKGAREAWRSYRHIRVRPLKPAEGGGVIKSLEPHGTGPVGLLQTQKLGIKSKKPIKASAARLGCMVFKRPLWEAEQTRRRRLAMSAFDPSETSGLLAFDAVCGPFFICRPFASC